MGLLVLLTSFSACILANAQTQIVVDDTTCRNTTECRRFDGVGAISGGGATSVFLRAYPEPQRSQILDYLFKPGFGASLHILKVEIGSDAETTDGAEASHMRLPWEENYSRGYEWWLMSEAKARNPNIRLYGLAWGWPVWVTCPNASLTDCQDTDPFTYANNTAQYVAKWVQGAKTTYGLDIDYVGIWNERYYNTSYIKTLKAVLDEAGLGHTAIMAPDGEAWDIAQDLLDDPQLAQAVMGIAAHYPGTTSTPQAQQTGKPMWASEDSSTYNNAVGGGCWARVLNQNFVNGNITASIAWNLAAAYPKGTHWYRAGLLNALTPWSGGYGSTTRDGAFTVGPMVWATAHTTQFTAPGWVYLPQGSGSGRLALGGSYVSFINATSGDLTIVIEKMTRNHSTCVRPTLDQFDVQPESIVFQLEGQLASITSLDVWYTHWAHHKGDVTHEFGYVGQVPVVDGRINMGTDVDSVFTLTTVRTGKKGSYGTPPSPALFPTAWTDDFNACPVPSEAPYFSDQNGAWECYDSGDAAHGVVMRQSTPLQPLHWFDVRPHSFIGHRDGSNSSLVLDGYIEEPGASVLMGVRMQGTDNWVPNGLIWSILAANTTGSPASWYLHTDLGSVDNNGAAVLSGTAATVQPGQWHTYRLDVNGTKLNAWIDGSQVITDYDATCALPSCTATGHAAIGTREYGHFSQFDNVQLYTAYTQCGTGSTALGPGTPVSAVQCSSEVGPRNTSQWLWSAQPGTMVGAFSLRADPSLCLAAVPNATSETWWLALATCNSTDALQIWRWTFDGVSPDHEVASTLALANGRCMDISARGDVGAQADAWPCNGQINQDIFYDFDTWELGNEAYAVCLGVC